MVSLLISLFFGVITLPNRTQSSFHTRIVLCLSTYGPITCIFGSVRGFSPRGTTSTGPCRILHCTNEAGRLIAEAAMGNISLSSPARSMLMHTTEFIVSQYPAVIAILDKDGVKIITGVAEIAR